MTDWQEWHRPYEDASSDLSRRRRVVQRMLRTALDEREGVALTVISMCAGDGRDVIHVLAERERHQVRALLVEFDKGLVAATHRAVASLGLAKAIITRRGDAADLNLYSDFAPAQIVLACGVFGNISSADVSNTITKLPQLIQPGGTVIWTRGRKGHDRTAEVRAEFAANRFDELDFVAPPDALFSVGMARYKGAAMPLDTSEHLFTFVW